MCIELLLSCVYVVFFFKQKTAYEMRISDWSSDVCSSDLLDTFTDTTPEMLAALTMQVLVVCGEQDRDNGSAEELVAALPAARLATIPGTQMSSVTQPEPGEAIAAFLTALPRLPRAPSCWHRARERSQNNPENAPMKAMNSTRSEDNPS